MPNGVATGIVVDAIEEAPVAQVVHVDPEAIAFVTPPVGLAFVAYAKVAERALQDLATGTGGFLLKVDDGADRDFIFRRYKARMKQYVLLCRERAFAHIAGTHEEGALVSAPAFLGGKERGDPEFHGRSKFTWIPNRILPYERDHLYS